MIIKDIYDCIDSHAPFAAQMEYDNAGLLVGNAAAPCTGVLVAVDMSESVIRQAEERGCNCIVTHHPLLWSAMRRVTDADYVGRLTRLLIAKDIHYIAAHTNVDGCTDGNSESLIRALGATIDGRLAEDDFVVRCHWPKPMMMSELLALVQRCLDDPLAYAVGKDVPVQQGALCTGAGCSDKILDACVREGLVYISGEAKHHQLRFVEDCGGHLIVVGHYASERIFVSIVGEWLRNAGVRVCEAVETNPRGLIKE